MFLSPPSRKSFLQFSYWYSFICILFGWLECVVYSYAYVAHSVFLRDVWIRTQRAGIASRRATNCH
jgi:hypothetical protein